MHAPDADHDVLRAIAADEPKFGMTQELVDSAKQALIIGAPLPATFFEAPAVGEKVVIGCFVAISSLTTFLTVRQSVTRSMAQMPDNPMAQSQKMLMYISPLFAIFSLGFPLGLILYWVTTNLWTLGQQHWFYSRYPMPQFDAKGNPLPVQPKRGLLARIRKKEPEPPPEPAKPKVKIIRQQPSRQPRSKRTGSKKS